MCPSCERFDVLIHLLFPKEHILHTTRLLVWMKYILLPVIFTFATLFNFMLVLSLVVHVTVFAQHLECFCTVCYYTEYISIITDIIKSMALLPQI